ncbi:hypothetical protein [Clostridium beijerinckii]|uniref:Uncharacterized protein n=1 Tax=Clostridium beijerinckii TaxID=1520 RepID=A0AAX0B6E7_CLOBE|nr:hypothetical protein [Clostridium beijerinckii]NRT90950.1 hypothetical protein [Clostridium beijerinckii]NYC70476.1 hypothetical protein [Clostridium beijerinckii]
MDVSKFNEKLNRVDGHTYVIEETVYPVNGIYEKELIHDNVNITTLNVYTGSRLTGDKIDSYSTSTPSMTPWKTIIRIFSSISPLYISYETTGDQIEAEDINNLQDAVVETQKSLNSEIDRAIGAEKALTDNLNTEISRAKSSENMLTNNLNSEITRAKGAESTLTNNLINEVNRATAAENNLNNSINSEVNRAKSAESTLAVNLNSEVTRATNAEINLTNNLNSEITRAKAAENTLTNTINTNKPNWDDKYTKNEVDNKISQVVSNMDWKESVGTYVDIATTYPTPNDGWTVNVKDTDITYRYSGSAWIPISANAIPLASSSVDGKMSKQDKIDHDDMNSKKHTHSNKGIIDIITQALIDNWNAAYTHISDTVKHITATERTLWNSVSNKSDVGHTHVAVNITDLISTIRSCALTGLSTTTNSIISASDTILGALGKLQSQITANLSTLTNHTSNTNNPHSTTASQIGLGNVTNDSQVKRSEMGAVNGVATLDSSGVNSQAPKSHTHDDRYYTESEANAKFATIAQITQAGYGDMMKNVYDSDNDGVIDISKAIQKYMTPNSSSSYTGQYSKIASITITSQYKDANAIIDITSTGSGNSIQTKGTLYFRVKQQNALGSLPYIDLKIVNSEVIGNGNFVAVITINTSTVTTVELYYKAVQSYDALVFVPIYNNDFIFYNNQAFISSLPSGNQIACLNLVSNGTLKPGLTWNDLEGV